MNGTVYLIRMKSDGSLASIWTTKELADAAVLFYDNRYGTGKVWVETWRVNVTLYQHQG